ncbi:MULTISPECIES: signal peptidase II [Enterococcus]|uniref:signal peptidase II n=1 Tax=Enterococcus TaxID=1350 RepID=UPI00065E05E9|nr:MULTISPECIES: signal peptidase II [Enterococcus]KAF1302487.1 signal peptidase II [Enterococcus sp. JM9B]
MLIIYLLTCLLILILDQIVKWWTVANFALGESQTVIPNIFSLTHIRNTGAAWSMMEGQIVFFAVVTIIAVSVCGYLLVKNRHGNKFFTFGLTLIIAGALGNFIDRVRLGYVVDMFQTDFINFPIFNVADMSLVIGVIMIFIYSIWDEKTKEKSHA